MSASEPDREQVVWYEFGPYKLDTADKSEHRLLCRGEPLKIQNKQFELLCVLVKNHGRYVTNEDLIQELWAETCPTPEDKPYWAAEKRSLNQRKLHKQISLLKDVVKEAKIENTHKAYALRTPVVDILSTDLKFSKWIIRSRQGRWVSLTLGVMMTLSVLYLLFYYLGPGGRLAGVEPATVLSLLQAVAVSVALAFSFIIFDRGGRSFPSPGSATDASVMEACGYTDELEWGAAKSIAQEALTEYNRYWKLLLSSWVLLYVTIAFTPPIGPPGGSDQQYYFVQRILATFFNNWNSLALALCYVVLNFYPTAPGAAEPNRGHLRLAKIIMISGVVGITLFAAAEALLVFDRLPAWLGAAEGGKVLFRGDMASGLIGGIALAQYVGRIQSRFLQPPALLPLMFYLYVVIQPLYLFIPDPVGGALIIEAALILKCILYLYMAWLFNSGRLLFYLVRVKLMVDTVDTGWKAFLLGLDKAQTQRTRSSTSASGTHLS
jgi:hypothetical protein